MEVQIDSGCCQGHGRCYDLAPACSVTTTRATGRCWATALCHRPERDARLAVLNCPEHAVELLAGICDMAVGNRFAQDYWQRRDGESRGTRSEIVTGPVADWATDFSHLDPGGPPTRTPSRMT